MTFRAVIVDDELLARQRIRQMLQDAPDVEVIGEYGNAPQALAQLRALHADVLFLDVRMAELDGVTLLEQLGDDAPPYVIFVTAYDQYALQAFDYRAVDYLLKPFDRERFHEALDRVRDLSETRAQADRTIAAAVTAYGPRYLDRIAVRAGDRVVLIAAKDIDWLEAKRNYVRIWSHGEAHLIRETMQHIEQKLDPAMFVRIHRGTIVNVERIRDLHPLFHGNYTVVLHDGTRLALSRGYREKLQERWGRAL